MPRRFLYHNPQAATWKSNAPLSVANLVEKFHHQLPGSIETPLVNLPEVARELGLRGVYVKDETSRYGLPSFKILGASLGTFRALTQKYDIPLDSDVETLRRAVQHEPVVLFAATDGNHGRAVARMAKVLGAKANIYVPRTLSPATVEFIRSEGAEVIAVDAAYDGVVDTASEKAREMGGLLVQDTAFDGYEDVPNWIVEGYSTMMREADSQLTGTSPDLVVVPIGVGSLAQSVVSHYKTCGKSVKILTVEPDTSACLWKSLSRGDCKPWPTSSTIMTGMDCGTVSSTAWPLLSHGVDASATVSDYECHLAVQELRACGLETGPCGGAPLAALQRLGESDKKALDIDEKSVVLLLCTEGVRDYDPPIDPSIDDPTRLTQALVQVDSSNPFGSNIDAPGETRIATYIAQWLEYRDIDSHWIEPVPGRPSVVGLVKGKGTGPSLMFNGHIDTVTLRGYNGNALGGTLLNGRIYGRGAADMKGGIAAMLCATARAKDLTLDGDVIFGGVADEENLSIGTEQILKAGWKADAAIVCEPTVLDVVIAHKGFVWVEVEIQGVAAHGSRPELGVDAITKAGYFLVALDQYAQSLSQGRKHALLGSGSVHASTIQGGEEVSSYPALCTILLERRTLPGETQELVRSEIERLLQQVAPNDPSINYNVRTTFCRSPFEIDPIDPFVTLVKEAVVLSGADNTQLRGEAFWTDSALLADAGTRTVMFGPWGEGLHASEEWVDARSIETCADALVRLAQEFCQSGN